jgi:hypothetical protein
MEIADQLHWRQGVIVPAVRSWPPQLKQEVRDLEYRSPPSAEKSSIAGADHQVPHHDRPSVPVMTRANASHLDEEEATTSAWPRAHHPAPHRRHVSLAAAATSASELWPKTSAAGASGGRSPDGRGEMTGSDLILFLPCLASGAALTVVFLLLLRSLAARYRRPVRASQAHMRRPERLPARPDSRPRAITQELT